LIDIIENQTGIIDELNNMINNQTERIDNLEEQISQLTAAKNTTLILDPIGC